MGTFVLGVGAQKAGTTWLADHLRRSPQYEPGYRKEYHVLDTLDLPSERWMRDRNTRLARQSLDRIDRDEAGDAEVLHRIAMFADLDFYWDYFTGLLGRDGVRATGDLTPDHAMLSAGRMRSVKDAFAERGVRTVAVFLMRDPVERVYSHIRMKAHRRPAQFSRPVEDELLAEHAHDSYARRTRYHQTLDNLREAFAPDEVHVGLYEQLFAGDDAQVRAISALAGIDFVEPRTDRRRNAAPRPDDALPESTARIVAEHYSDTYRGVAARCPGLDVARWWPHARFVL